MKSKVIIVRGPICVGKSSISHLLSDKLKEKVKKLAYIPIDVSIYPFMKTFSKLSNKERRDIMQENVELILENFLKRKFTVIVDGGFHRKHNNEFALERLIRIAKKYKIKTDIIELYAPLGILHKRISERKKNNPCAWNNPKETEEKYKKFMKTLHKGAILIDTENKSVEKIVNQIFRKIK